MYINKTIQQNDIKNKLLGDSYYPTIQQKQGFQQPLSTNLQSTGQPLRPDNFQSYNIMSLNDIQRHVQSSNYENTTPTSKPHTKREKQEENVVSNQNSYINMQPRQKYQGDDSNHLKQDKTFNNQQYHIQQRSGRPPPIQSNDGSTSYEYEYQSSKKLQVSMNNLNNSNNKMNKVPSKNCLKIKELNEIQCELNKQHNTGNTLNNGLNSPSSSSMSMSRQTNNGFKNFSQLTKIDQQNLQIQTQNQQKITNRWLFANQQTIQNSNIIYQNNLGQQTKIIAHQNEDPTQKQEEQQNSSSYSQNRCQPQSNQSQSSSSTPRDKIQSPSQNPRLSQLDFGSNSQSQLKKNQARFYQSKNTQFIKNKQQQSFQQILQQHPFQQQSNQLQLKEQNHLPCTSDFTFQIETPKYQGFSQFLQNNTKSSENLHTNIQCQKPNMNFSNLRQVTPDEFTNRYKITNQNIMETPHCNFSALQTNKEQSQQKQQQSKQYLNKQLIQEEIQSKDQHEYLSNILCKPLTFYNDQSKMTPSYQDRKKQLFKNEINENNSSSYLQIYDEKTPTNKGKQQKNRCISYQNDQVGSQNNQFNTNQKENQFQNHEQIKHGTENSLSVEEHLDDSVLDEKISRSMFKANPSQHIQQKVQYESIVIKCIHCQQEQSLLLKKILDTLKSLNINNQLAASYFFHDYQVKQDVSEFQIASNEQKKLNMSSYSNQTLSLQKTQNPYSNQESENFNKQIKDMKEQLETSSNNFSKNASDSNRTIKQLNCMMSINNFDLRKKSLDVQRSIQSTTNQNLNNFKSPFMKNFNETFTESMDQQVYQLNEQLKSEIKSLKDSVKFKNHELDFQQKKIDDMNTQIKNLTVKLQDIEQKYSIDQQIISNLELENNKMMTNLTNTLLLKLKLS